MSKPAAGRIIDCLGPSLALRQRKRFRKDTALTVDGALAPAREHSTAHPGIESGKRLGRHRWKTERSIA